MSRHNWPLPAGGSSEDVGRCSARIRCTPAKFTASKSPSAAPKLNCDGRSWLEQVQCTVRTSAPGSVSEPFRSTSDRNTDEGCLSSNDEYRRLACQNTPCS